MKLVKILLTTTFVLTAATTTFAATKHVDQTEKVIVSTQKLPEAATTDETSVQPTTSQPATSESAAEDTMATPSSHTRS
ncbi:hypothetical protein [Acinetobacter sp. ANC 4648]|uniref:hypothetical protein n=1 Tax=Acinetobacter sp. ANC 4648 TaxID=1977875 RepID=UPI000A33422A|nr:hypothetical protein [Acinetobacter sp. ANC 4648]OTG83810.1 hypothetical protein B9T27_04705 [Acinetobacter sp. ANC 4648]